MAKPRLIATVGMPGAGKSLVSRVAESRGIPTIACGDVIREEVTRRGLQPTPVNMAEVMLAIRQQQGPAVVAERLIPKIDRLCSPIVLVEGVRSMAEVDELRKRSGVTILGIHASPKTRYERLRARGRTDDPKQWEEFQERDMRELSVGIGDVISLADRMLINESSQRDLEAGSDSALTEMKKG